MSWKSAGLTVLAAGLLGAALAAAPPEPKVGVETLSEEPVLAGAQFLAADGDGDVYLLAGETLAVYPVSRHGDLGDPSELRPLAGTADELHVLAAAVSRTGDAWLVHSAQGAPVRLFRAGKEVTIPAPDWNVTAIGWKGNEAVAAVGSRRPGGGAPGLDRDTPPAAVVLEEREWEPWLDREEQDPLQDVDVIRLRRAQEEVHLAPGSERSLWVAARNRYWIRELSPTGKVVTEIVVGTRSVEFRERNEAELDQLAEVRERAREQGVTIPKSHGATPVAQKVIDGIAEGRDGRLYVLLPPAKGEGAGSLLDRYDPVRGVIERVELDLPGYTSQGRRSVVAGADGLYVANFKGNAGRWRISWETLEEAAWERVEDSRIE